MVRSFLMVVSPPFVEIHRIIAYCFLFIILPKIRTRFKVTVNREKVKSKTPERFRIQVFWWGMVDSLFCGKATAVATCHRHVAKSRLSNPPNKKYRIPYRVLGIWWGMVDSNHRRQCQQIYSLSPLATREIPHIKLLELVDGLEPPTC